MEEAHARTALRELMSELSDAAYCAGWHYDTEYCLWEIMQGKREGWARLDANDPRIAELHRLHHETGGWWRFNPELEGGWGDKEFLMAAVWEEVYVRTVNDKERAVSAVIDGKILRGQAAVDATARVLGPLLKKAEQ